MAGLENAAMSSSSSLSSSRAAVAGGSFAPALAHARGTGNCPTSLVVFDSGSSFETPSFFVQELFAGATGRALAACSTTSGGSGGGGSGGAGDGDGALGGVAASASCKRERCLRRGAEEEASATIFVKIVNYGPMTRRVRVAFVESVNGTAARRPVPLSRDAAAAPRVTLLAHPDPAASNSFSSPRNVRPAKANLTLDGPGAEQGIVELELPPYSLAVLEVEEEEEGGRRQEREEEEGALEEQR